jgi:hypothetical protein
MSEDSVSLKLLPSAQVWSASYDSFHFTITLQRERLHLSIGGEFSADYTWTSVGGDFISALQGLNKDYLMGKLLEGPTILDVSATRDKLVQMALDDDEPAFAEAVRNEEFYSVGDLQALTSAFDLDDPSIYGSCIVQGYHASVNVFFDYIWPAWVKQL